MFKISSNKYARYLSGSFSSGHNNFLNCNYIFRKKNLKSDSIAIIPELGYNSNQRTSKKTMLWLKYYSETSVMYNQHAKNEGQYFCVMDHAL